jgi:hypothetical protein
MLVAGAADVVLTTEAAHTGAVKMFFSGQV